MIPNRNAYLAQVDSLVYILDLRLLFLYPLPRCHDPEAIQPILSRLSSSVGKAVICF